MIKQTSSIFIILMISSCSMLGGPDGYFPDKKYDFLKEAIEETISVPDELDSPNLENHYPVNKILEVDKNLEIPKPRQIFASAGDSSVVKKAWRTHVYLYRNTSFNIMAHF